MFCEVVEKMIYDIRGENLDTFGIGVCLGFFVDLDVKAEHDCVLFSFFEHNLSGHDVSLVHGTDGDVGHGDFGNFEEFEEGFEGAEGGCLDANATAGFRDSL